jgi:hypothetical protein
MSAHSKIVGGSTASRVINCPGSVALTAKMPPQAFSKYAAEGTLLHDVIAAIIDGKTPQRISEELHDTKIMPALALFRPALLTRLYGAVPGDSAYLLLQHLTRSQRCIDLQGELLRHLG